MVVFAVLCLFFFLIVPAESTQSLDIPPFNESIGIVVMPLKNNTGDKELDWLSIGLQSAMTDDLARLTKLEVWTRLWSGMPLFSELEKWNRDEILYHAKMGYNVDIVWLGSYSGSKDNLSFHLEAVGLSGEEPNVVAESRLNARLDQMWTKRADLLSELIQKMGIQLSPSELAFITPKTAVSINAWELNAEGIRTGNELRHLDRLLEDYDDRVEELAARIHMLNKQAVESDPHYAAAWKDLGAAYLIVNKPVDAVKMFTQALKMDPGEDAMNLAVAYDRAGEKQKALEYFLAAVKANPSISHRRVNLAAHLVDLGRITEAIPIASDCLNSRVPFVIERAVQLLADLKTEDTDRLLVQTALENNNAAKSIVKVLKNRALASKDTPYPPPPYSRKTAALLLDLLPVADENLSDQTCEALHGILSKNETFKNLLLSKIESQNPQIRKCVCRSLAAMEHYDSMPRLIEVALNDSNAGVKSAALSALTEKVQELDYAWERVRPEEREAIATLQEKLPNLAGLLKHADEDVRGKTVYLLGQIGGEVAIKALKEVTSDEEIGAYALTALERLQNVAEEIDPAIRIAAINGDDKALQQLISMLSVPNEDFRLRVVEALEQTGRIEAVHALVPLLEDEEVGSDAKFAIGDILEIQPVEVLNRLIKTEKPPLLRAWAAWVLRYRDDPRAVEGLMEIVKNNDHDSRIMKKYSSSWHEDIRLEAIEALASRGDRRAAPVFIHALKNPEFRLKAIEGLKNVKDPRAVSELIKFVNDPDEKVRQEIVYALTAFKDKSTIDLLKNLALNDSSSDVRCSAIDALGQLKDIQLLPLFLQASKDRAHCSYVEKALALLPGNAGVPELEKLIDHPEARIKASSLGALGILKNPRYLNLFSAALESGDESVRRAAFYSILDLKDDRVFPICEKVFKTESLPGLRAASLRAIVESKIAGDPTPYLRLALKDPDAEVQEEALNLIDENRLAIAPALIAPFLASSDYRIRLRVIRIIGRSKSPENLTILENFFPQLLTDVFREEAFKEIAAIGSDKLNKKIIGLLGYKDFLVRMAAATAVGVLRMPEAVPALIELLDDNEHVRAEAALSLGRLGSKEALKPLINEMYLGSAEAAARALGMIGDPAAIPYLQDRLKYSINRDTRIAAAEALQAIGSPSGAEELICEIKRLKRFDDGPTRFISRLAENGTTRSIDALYELLTESPMVPVFRIVKEKRLLPSDVFRFENSAKGLSKAMMLYLRAQDYGNMQNYQEQLHLADRALQQIDPQMDVAMAILCMWMKASVYLRLEQNQQALQAIEQAESLVPLVQRGEIESYQEFFEEQTLYWKGQALLNSGSNEQKRIVQEMYSDLAITIEEELRFGYFGYEAVWRKNKFEQLLTKVLSHLGVLEIESGKVRLAKAIELGRNYASQDEEDLETEKIRYLGLSQQRLAEGKYEEAQKLIEELNLRQLQYKRRSINISLADERKQAALQEYDKRKKDIEDLEARIAAAQVNEGADVENDTETEKETGKEDSAILRQRLSDSKSRLREYLTLLKREHPDLSALLDADPIPLTQVQSKLPEDVAILQYLLLQEKVVVFVVRKNYSIEIVETPLDIRALKARVNHFVDALKSGAGVVRKGIAARRESSDPETLKKIATELYEQLIQPIKRAGYLSGVRIIGVAPNGILHYLPFGALLGKDGKELVENYSLFYVNSTSLLWVAFDRDKKQRDSNTELVAISNPDKSLLWADREVERISRYFSKKKIYPHEAAKKAVLKEISGSPAILHLATHGLFDSIDGRKSRLVMADGDLTVQDIWGLPLNAVSLTTLSACETGVGEILSGDDIISLESAFIYAGSPSVVATLWPVDDEATSEFMALFYENLEKGLSKADAIAVAQRSIKKINKWSSPYYWAPFTIRGAWM